MTPRFPKRSPWYLCELLIIELNIWCVNGGLVDCITRNWLFIYNNGQTMLIWGEKINWRCFKVKIYHKINEIENNFYQFFRPILNSWALLCRRIKKKRNRHSNLYFVVDYSGQMDFQLMMMIITNQLLHRFCHQKTRPAVNIIKYLSSYKFICLQ